MAYKKYSRKSYKRVGKSQRKNDTLKKMTGGAPKTAIERLAGYAGNIGVLAKTVAKIMTFINVETKYYENTQTYQTVPASGSGYILYLNNISQGNGENERNGEKVVNKNLTINYGARIHTSGVSNIIGIIIVYDKKPEIGQTTTVWTDVMNSASPLAQVNKENGDRFVILARRMLELTQAGQQQLTGKIFCKLEKVHTDWNSATATDWEKGAIKAIAISDDASTLLNPTLELRSRINFYDN